MKSTVCALKFAIGKNVQAARVPVIYFREKSILCLRPFSSQMSSTGATKPPNSSPEGISSSMLTKNEEHLPKSQSADGHSASIGKAMQAYLKRAKEHQAFMDKQEKEFVFGRRHLANMMGKDPENFTQKDIDEAIRYLFPCGLYEPRARPIMKPPDEIYPKQKSAQFDLSGRPHHPFFYTAKPNFYYLLHEMTGKLNSLNKLASSKSAINSEDSVFTGSRWLSKEELEIQLLEKITDEMYSEWIHCFERLANHPKRDRELELIKLYRKPLEQQSKAKERHTVTLEPDGRKSVHITYCARKTSRADVLVTVPGTGQFKINGKGLDYFRLIPSRQAVISPLQLVGWLGKADVEANCTGGVSPGKPHPDAGEISRALAVRYGIANAVAALGADEEKLRLAGYIQYDRKKKERKKIAHDGARAKWTWKKR